MEGVKIRARATWIDEGEKNSHYKTLYNEKQVLDIKLDNIINKSDMKTLTDVEKQSLEGDITDKECIESLKKMKNNKSPGSSAFTVDFFKFFWIDIGQFLVRSLTLGLTQGHLSVSPKQGIITCIQEGDKDKTYMYLKNGDRYNC